MKKLLLLTTLPLVAFLTSFAGKEQGPGFYERTLNDTTVEKTADPKSGFRDLFVSPNSDGSFFNVQMNPKAVSFVQDYMDGHTLQLTKMKSWGRPYFDLIDKVLAQHKLPTELKYLSVIESDLKNSAVSWAGAVGPWQLMPQTAQCHQEKRQPQFLGTAIPPAGRVADACKEIYCHTLYHGRRWRCNHHDT
jgi:membrane-bound lytic murein transglycosylase D